jgi:hypothetical protein
MSKPIAITGMLCLLMGAHACAGEAASGAPQDALLIKDVTLISPERDAPLSHADVLIRDGRIAQIGIKLVFGDLPSINGTGRFLIPGLIDSHVHVNHLVGMDDDVVEKHPELLAAYREQLPRAYLAFGFTTLVDLDLVPGTLDWFDAQPLRPRLYNCGPGVRIPAGYMTQRITRDAKLTKIPNLVYEPTQSQQWPAMLDARDYSPEKAVERAVATHAIWPEGLL